MKIGSLVMLKDFRIARIPENGEILPRHKVVYTIRDIENDGSNDPGIRLEEIINPICPSDGEEYSYCMSCFNELLPPIKLEISELLEEQILL